MWRDDAVQILMESVRALEAGEARSALHAAYDALSLVLELGLPYGPNYPGGYFSYLPAITRALPANHSLKSSLLDMGPARERMAHRPYRTPTLESVRRHLQATLLFCESAGIPLTIEMTTVLGSVQSSPATGHLAIELFDGTVELTDHVDTILKFRAQLPRWRCTREPGRVSFAGAQGSIRVSQLVLVRPEQDPAQLLAELCSRSEYAVREGPYNVIINTDESSECCFAVYEVSQQSSRRGGIAMVTSVRHQVSYAIDIQSDVHRLRDFVCSCAVEVMKSFQRT